VGVGERHPLGGQAIDVRRGDLAAVGVEGVDVAVAEVVGEEEDDVGAARAFGGCGADGERGEQQGGEEFKRGLHGGFI
jgi:hypothetical protein